MNGLLYQTHDKLPLGKNLIFAMQQVLSIIAATILIPVLSDATGIYLSSSSALIGAGVGTLIYLFLTKFESPVFLGSSFSFISPLITAVTFGYFGIILGSIFSGLTYVTLAIIIKFVGADWINKIMPPVVIGPIVAMIGFNLARTSVQGLMFNNGESYNLVSIVVGLITFLVVILISVKGNKKIRPFPFIIGILIGYIIALILTIIGNSTNTEVLQIVNLAPFEKISNFKNWLPNFTFIGAINEGLGQIKSLQDVLTIFLAFFPIAIVSFTEHLADHKNISSIIGKDLLKTPGLHRTLLGDGLGTIFGSFFGGCPTTTYGESIGCVALSKNASTSTILLASIICIVVAFIYPIILFFETIPLCVVGGISIALYGFISISGLRMLKEVNLNENKNVFIIAAIFICGIGGLEIQIGNVVISNIACALIIGILCNVILRTRKHRPIISEEQHLITDKIETNQDEISKERSMQNENDYQNTKIINKKKNNDKIKVNDNKSNKKET